MDHRPSEPLGLSAHTATRLAIGLLLLGLAWRVIRYSLRFPIWGDEAMLAMNFIWLDYGQMMSRLENCQVAPLLFMWAERTALNWLGPGELSLRLLPQLAAVLSLVLYWRLTGLLLCPQARLFATGFLAVASAPVAMSTCIKPYSIDLLASLALLVLAVQWSQAPGEVRWLVALTALAPVALLSSYPAVFTAGAVSLALLPAAWRQGWSARGWFTAYNAAMLAGFLLAFVVGKNQLHTVARGEITTAEGMNLFWRDNFPPPTVTAFPGWFLRAVTGKMAAYPLGGYDGRSAFTVLLGVIGVACWARRRRWVDLVLLTAPLGLTLVAAAMHRYPFGGVSRLCQHLAPGWCVLAGVGLSALVDWSTALPAVRVRWALTVTALFAAVGIGGICRDFIRPYQGAGCVWKRATMAEMRELAPGPVVICGDSSNMGCVFVWYWLTEGERVSWNYHLPPAPGDQLWGVYEGQEADAACRRLAERLTRCDPAWRLVQRVPYHFSPPGGQYPERWELFCFTRSP